MSKTKATLIEEAKDLRRQLMAVSEAHQKELMRAERLGRELVEAKAAIDRMQQQIDDAVQTWETEVLELTMTVKANAATASAWIEAHRQLVVQPPPGDPGVVAAGHLAGRAAVTPRPDTAHRPGIRHQQSRGMALVDLLRAGRHDHVTLPLPRDVHHRYVLHLSPVVRRCRSPGRGPGA